MLNAVFKVPTPVNEPVKSFAPGSPEKASLKARLSQMLAEEIEIPLIIGGQEIRTGDMAECVCPHDHGKVLGRYHKATAEQVQAAWLKLPDIVQSRDEIAPFPTNSLAYRDQLAVVVQNAMDLYPNLHVIYLSTRIYAGYNTSGRPSPEPLAYENGFGVKWLIADQIAGDPTLNADERRGEIEAPWLAWGPHMWADGTTPRSDGLVWECADLQDDGIHPSPSGSVKVADMLIEHLTNAPTAAPWFSASGEPIGDVELPPPAHRLLMRACRTWSR